MTYDARFRYRLEVYDPAHPECLPLEILYGNRLLDMAYCAAMASLTYPEFRMVVVKQKNRKRGHVVRWLVCGLDGKKFLEPLSKFEPDGGTLPLFTEVTRREFKEDEPKGDDIIDDQLTLAGVYDGQESQAVHRSV